MSSRPVRGQRGRDPFDLPFGLFLSLASLAPQKVNAVENIRKNHNNRLTWATKRTSWGNRVQSCH